MQNSLNTIILIISLLGACTSFSNQDNRKPLDTAQFEAVGQLFVLINPKIRYSGFSIVDKVIQKEADKAARLGQDFKYNFCSATVVSQKLILTAAHCALTLQNLQKAQMSVFFQSAQQNKRAILISKIFKFGSFSLKKKFSEDWAILESMQTIDDIKPIKLLTLSAQQKEEALLLSAGFPWVVSGKVLAGNVLMGSHCQFIKLDQVRNLAPEAQDRMFGADITNCKASVGNSGGPLLIQKSNHMETNYYVVGVMAAAQKESGLLASGLGYKTNYYLFTVSTQTIWDNLR